MAPSHVPTDHHSLQGHAIYSDSTFDNLFPAGADHQYGNTSWNQPHLAQHHTSLAPNVSAAPSWQHNAYPQQSYNAISQPYTGATHTYQTSSPYQYSLYSNHGPLGNYTHSPVVDPALGVDPMAIRQQQQSPYQIPLRNPTPQGQPGTVTPQALQQNPALQHARAISSPYQVPKSTTEMFTQRPVLQLVNNPKYEMPTGKQSGGFTFLDQAALASATKSTALNKLVNLGSEPFHLPANRTLVPTYNLRQSVKDLKKVGAGSRKVLKDMDNKRRYALIMGHSRTGSAGKANAGSPAVLKTGMASDSESYSESSEDETDYSDDEEAVEASPLPATRPDEPHPAIQYDIIKATWFPRKDQPPSDKIKGSLRDFWEVLNTIQKRWRADSKAVSEAEEKKLTGELPVLKSRVTSQRDLLQTALRSTLEYAHPDVLYHVGQVKPFLYLCYQFLANRFKMQDVNGPLSTVIYEVLARSSGTLTTELLEETKVIKALNSMKKTANDSNKALILKIIEGATAGSKKPKVSSPPQIESAEPTNTKRPAAQPAARPTSEGPAAKKLKPTETASGLVKKPATSTATISKVAPTTNAVPQKRPGERPTTTLNKVRSNQVANKPSTFFSTLNAPSKKPTTAAPNSTAKPSIPQKTAAGVAKDKKPAAAAPSKPAYSFAETMANLLKPREEPVAPVKPQKQLPPETPEEKAKRLRKESRRHLRVTFRPEASLLDIRYFHHDPEEEVGHDENFVRDAGSIGDEGRMFKQHREMDLDEDDEEQELRPWVEPINVDFSVVSAEERERNYEPYGGGKVKPHCPEKEVQENREKSTLMVFYSQPSDIPSTPRELVEPPAETPTSVKEFGTPPPWVLNRCPKQSTSAPPPPDLLQLENIFKQFAIPTTTAPPPAVTQNVFVPPQAAAPAPFDISAILGVLNGAPPPLPVPAQPAAPPVPDWSSLLSALGNVNSGAFPPPPAAWPQFPPQLYQQLPQSMPDYQQPQQLPYNEHANGGTKRARDDGYNNNNNERGSFKKQKGGKPNYHAGERPHKVIPCKFFQQGKCSKGKDCTFIHEFE